MLLFLFAMNKMKNFKQFQQEKDDRYKKHLQTLERDYEKHRTNTIKEKEKQRSRKVKLHQEILVLDSNDRDTSQFISPSSFDLKTIETFENVVAIRLIRTEYTIADSFTSVLINNQPIPLQFFKPIHAFVYLNGYNKLKIANKLTTPIFSQISAGVETLPPCNDDIRLDPYAYILNPIEKRLDRFEVKILTNEGNVVEINEPEKVRVVLTLAIYTIA